MAFDNLKDKILWDGEIDGEKGTTLTVVVASYNDGPMKIGINRTHGEGEDKEFRKLGRMSVDEAEKLLPFLQEAVKEAKG